MNSRTHAHYTSLTSWPFVLRLGGCLENLMGLVEVEFLSLSIS